MKTQCDTQKETNIKRQISKTKQKSNHLLFVIFYLLTTSYCLSLVTFYSTQSAFADQTTNDNYTIDVGDIDTNPQPSPHLSVKKENRREALKTTGYKDIISSPENESNLSLSQNTIDFGILSSTNPIIRTSTLSLSGAKDGSQIFVYENHPLLSSTHDTIPNTNCDNGACSPLLAALWNNTLTFGFGYRCDSDEQNACDSQFANEDYYKVYPDASHNQPFTIILSDQTNKKIKATITYKVNISGTQKAGGYYNSITYLAIPNF